MIVLAAVVVLHQIDDNNDDKDKDNKPFSMSQNSILLYLMLRLIFVIL
jgi:hypothetical protein